MDYKIPLLIFRPNGELKVCFPIPYPADTINNQRM